MPVRRQGKELVNADEGKTDLDKRRYMSSIVERKANKNMSTDRKRRAAVTEVKQAMHDLQRKINKFVKIQRKANKGVKTITARERPSNSARYNSEELGSLADIHTNKLERRKETPLPCFRQRRESRRILNTAAVVLEGKTDTKKKRDVKTDLNGDIHINALTKKEEKQKTGSRRCTELLDVPKKKLVKTKQMELRLAATTHKNLRVRDIVRGKAERRDAKMDANGDKHESTLMATEKRQRDEIRRCSKCKIFKPLDQYSKHQRQCRRCFMIYQQWKRYDRTRTKHENEDIQQLKKDFFTKRWNEIGVTE